jgi:hypothetical protein
MPGPGIRVSNLMPHMNRTDRVFVPGRSNEGNIRAQARLGMFSQQFASQMLATNAAQNAARIEELKKTSSAANPSSRSVSSGAGFSSRVGPPPAAPPTEPNTFGASAPASGQEPPLAGQQDSGEPVADGATTPARVRASAIEALKGFTAPERDAAPQSIGESAGGSRRMPLERLKTRRIF